MNADGGVITKNNSFSVTYQIAPYGSVILYASTKNAKTDNALTTSPIFGDKQNQISAISKWNINVDSVEIKDTVLFDWKTNDKLKFSSGEGIYTSTFQWQQSDLSKHYFLDLGKVCFTAEVYINGKLAGKRIYAPYQLDITSFLKQGTNDVEVHIATGQLNGYIGKAKNGDTKYRQFKGKENQIMSAGLIGPVVIRMEK